MDCFPLVGSRQSCIRTETPRKTLSGPSYLTEALRTSGLPEDKLRKGKELMNELMRTDCFQDRQWDTSTCSYSFSSVLILYSITGSLVPIPGDLGHQAGYTRDRFSILCRSIHTHSQVIWKRQISLVYMFLDWRKPECPEGTQQEQGGQVRNERSASV